MIPNVVKGGDMRGLLRYLVDTDPERTHNVHSNPHVIGGDSFVMAWHGAEELDKDSAGEISEYLDEPRKRWGTEVRAKVTEVDETTGKRVTSWRDQNVWHCSLSLRSDERTVSDDEWSAITQDFMNDMGFTEASGKVPARWVAIHHGVSKDGNDHVHIAASMVREDGTRWDGRWRDFQRAQDSCRDLERKYGLQVVAGREAGLSPRGEKAAEQNRAQREGRSDVISVELAHRIRSAAVASATEDEWIRRCRKADVVLKPRYARGSTAVVVGYQAALKSDGRGRLLFYGGQKLGKDLSLPRVRELFDSPTIEQADAASAEWQAAAKGQPPVGTGRETWAIKSAASVKAAEALAEQADSLARIDPNDHAAWGNVARDASGALSSWARFDPDNREDLNAAARQVARSAQVRRRGVPHSSPRPSTALAAAVLLQTQSGGKGKVAGVVLMRQLMATVQAVHDRHVQVGHAGEARMMREHAIERLQKVSTIGYGSELMGAGGRSTSTAVLEAQRIASALKGEDNSIGLGDGKHGPDGPLPRPLGPGRQRSGARDRDDRGHGKY